MVCEKRVALQGLSKYFLQNSNIFQHFTVSELILPHIAIIILLETL